MMEDVTQSPHGRENNIYRAPAQQLSASQNPFLSTLGEKVVKDRKDNLAVGSGAEIDNAARDTHVMNPQAESSTRSKYPEKCSGVSSLHSDTARELTDLGHFVRANEVAFVSRIFAMERDAESSQ